MSADFLSSLLAELDDRPERMHAEWTREEDAELWARHVKGEDPQTIAEALGRGLGGVENRVKLLSSKQANAAQARLWSEQVELKPRKVALRPAKDVMERIMFDATINASEFTVGYVDRFDGLMEVQFDAPNLSINGTERLMIKALPEHRIEYFRYRRRLIWHKQRRYDVVFASGQNSTGERLAQVIAGYDQWEANQSSRRAKRAAEELRSLVGDEAFNDIKDLCRQVAKEELSPGPFVAAIASLVDDLGQTGMEMPVLLMSLRALLSTLPNAEIRGLVLQHWDESLSSKPPSC